MRLTAIRAKYFGIVTDADNIGSFSGPLSHVTNLPLSLFSSPLPIPIEMPPSLVRFEFDSTISFLAFFHLQDLSLCICIIFSSFMSAAIATLPPSPNVRPHYIADYLAMYIVSFCIEQEREREREPGRLLGTLYWCRQAHRSPHQFTSPEYNSNVPFFT